MKSTKLLDMHVSFTLMVPKSAATEEVRAAIKETVKVVFGNAPGVRIRDVEVGVPHDPKKV